MSAEFAKYLGTTPVSVSRWEHGEDIGKENDKLIRYFYLRFKEEKIEIDKRITQPSVAQLTDLNREEKSLNMNVKVGSHGDVTAKFVTANA
jgi:hypothetical protein